MLKLSIVLLAIIATIRAVPIDNGVEGDPEIECGPTSITINFNTRNEFEGHVYVKGLFAEPGCRNDEGGRQVAGISLPFDTCGVRRSRSLNPKGVFVTTTVVITFHPLFVTKVDRAYRVQCFYMEADKTVDTNLEVSELTTQFRTQGVPMPVCRYEILDGGPTGQVVEYAIVGQAVFHKWTCDTETVDTFCMIVHSCYVDDTNGDRVDLIQADGCANDLYILNNLEYNSDLMAGVEAHVFKYADRANLYFQCQITILVKEPNAACPRPQCPTPAGRGAGSANPKVGAVQNTGGEPFPLQPGSPYLPGGEGAPRPQPRPQPQTAAPQTAAPAGTTRRPATPAGTSRGKRSVDEMAHAVGTMDVLSEINTLDIDDRTGAIPSGLNRQPSIYRTSPRLELSSADGFCVSTPKFVALICMAVGVILIVVIISTFLLLRKSRKA